MPKTKVRKEEDIRNYVTSLGSASVIMADLSRMQVNDLNAFRRKAEKEGVGIVNVKKTLLTIALKEAGIEGVNPKGLSGSVYAVNSSEDAVAPARLLAELKKTEKDKVVLLGGIVESKWADVAAVEALAKLPSKQQLLAQVVGTLNAPVSGFVNVLSGNLRNLANVLNAIKDAKTA